jgi:type II secretory pathway predicted ATPase ExeA
MYLKHFGLTRRPFGSTADTPAYYPATSHEQALRQLSLALANQEGFALLTGEPGAGKTLVAQRLLEAENAHSTCLFLTNTHFPDAADLFQALLYDLGQPYQDRSEQELRLALTEQLLEQFGQGKPALLLIDEAHHLSPRLLEELRLLGNLEARDAKVVQVVLIGLPGIVDTLKQPELAALAQRVRTRVRLLPLDVHEGVDYVLHHLRAAGGRPERVITEEALELIARGTHGVPRLLNQATDAALQLALSGEQQQVDAEAALEALGEMGLSADEEGDEPADVVPVIPVIEADSKRNDTAKPRRLFGSLRRPA